MTGVQTCALPIFTAARVGRTRAVLQWLLIAAGLSAMAWTVVFLITTRREPSRQINAARATLAVLPFQVLNRQEDIGFLRLAIPDAITARLALAGNLRVSPTDAVVHAQPDEQTMPELARVLGVDYLLTGTIQKI